MLEINKKSNLVLIDDDPSMLRLIQAVLENHFQERIEVETYEDPETAVERILRNKVDIILSDLEMPNVDGIEILKTVKNRNPFAQVILLTGNSKQEAIVDALENGASDYLLKPVDKTLLLKLLEQAYERQTRWQHALAETWRQKKRLVV